MRYLPKLSTGIIRDVPAFRVGRSTAYAAIYPSRWTCPNGGTPTATPNGCRCISYSSGSARDVGPCVWV